jgi:hypothetical protein
LKCNGLRKPQDGVEASKRTAGELRPGFFYFRSLSHLSIPSEIRSVLQLGRNRGLTQVALTSEQLRLSKAVLDTEYFSFDKIIDIKSNEKDILFAFRSDITSYSEFQMSSGERTILRLSKDISDIRKNIPEKNGAIVLIDEVEAGLHPICKDS